MERNTKIIKYVKEDVDIFGDGDIITTYSIEVYELKFIRQITKEEFEEKKIII